MNRAGRQTDCDQQFVPCYGPVPMVAPADVEPCRFRIPPGAAALPAATRWCLVAGALALALCGCAPSLATLQPAHVAPAGHAQATVGMEIAVPTGTVSRLIDAGESLANDARTRTLSDAEISRLLQTGVTLASSPPSIGHHLAIAYTPRQRTEIGLRHAGGGWRLGGRYQLLDRFTGPFDMVVGLGVARASMSTSWDKIIPYLEARGFTRWTFDVPLLIGTSGDWFRVWGGPKFLYSQFDTSVTVSAPMNPVQAGSLRGRAFYVGAQGGIALGYRHLFLGVELTMAQMSGSADVATMVGVAPTPTDISGFVVYPSFALMGEF